MKEEKKKVKSSRARAAPKRKGLRSSAAPSARPRRRAVPTVPSPYDRGVPLAFLLSDARNPVETSGKPVIRSASSHQLSPFVIHLSSEPAVPFTLPAATEDPHAIRLNFLVPEPELAPWPSEQTSPETSVASMRGLSFQLREDDRTPSSVPVLPDVSLSRSALPILSDIREAVRVFRRTHGVVDPPASVFDPARFRPPTCSSSRVSLTAPALVFEFPEPEDGEEAESDVLTLEDLERSAQARENGSPGVVVPARIRFSWRFLDFVCGFHGVFHSVRRTGMGLRQTVAERLRRFASPVALPFGWQRALGVFVLLSFACVLPLHAMETLQGARAAKGGVEEAGRGGLERLQSAAATMLARDPAAAAAAFAQAGSDFAKAKDHLEEIRGTAALLVSVLPQTRKRYGVVEELLVAGDLLSRAGQRMSEGMAALGAPASSPTTKLEVLSAYLRSTLPDLEGAEKRMRALDTGDVPESYRAQLGELQALAASFTASVREFTSFSQAFASLLGSDGSRRYLLVFQNNAELRPTGGFMGTFALLDLEEGRVRALEIPEGGTYDLQGSLRTSVIAPEPLRLVNARWEFQDANWFPDFPASARRILETYGDAGGPSVDGVIAVNATFFASLLSVLGPLDMPEYGRTVDADNFLLETQKVVEYEYVAYQDPTSLREEDAPKAFIGDIADRAFERLASLNERGTLALFDRLSEGLRTKDVQAFFPNTEIQAVARDLGWTGEVKTAEGDYLMLVDANVGGGKTDGVIEQDVDLDVAVQPDGRVVNTLTVRRAHHGAEGELFTGVNNVDYLRVYVPLGSRLIEADGFTVPDASLFEQPEEGWLSDPDVRLMEEAEEVDAASGTRITQEFGKTAFGNWVQTRPGTVSTARFVYELPFTVQLLADASSFTDKVKEGMGFSTLESYILTLQKQSGVLDREIRVHVRVPASLEILWTSEDAEEANFSNETDAFYSLLLARSSSL
ncbi:DUF4012 domain-containing protein [Candidatus Uhrbacteria bacterium]|nr:DUF4012 domain-containing protein [Candidatus Uhrbacteria bacterium]